MFLYEKNEFSQGKVVQYPSFFFVQYLQPYQTSLQKWELQKLQIHTLSVLSRDHLQALVAERDDQKNILEGCFNLLMQM